MAAGEIQSKHGFGFFSGQIQNKTKHTDSNRHTHSLFAGRVVCPWRVGHVALPAMHGGAINSVLGFA